MKKTVIVGLSLVVLTGSLLVSQSLSDQSHEVKVHENIEKEVPVPQRIYTNSDQDKRDILTLMLNASNHFETATGNFDYYSQNAGEAMTVDFSVDMKNYLSYERNTYQNQSSQDTSHRYEESIYNGKYIMVYRSDDYRKAMIEEMPDSDIGPQLHYTRVSNREHIKPLHEDTIEERMITEEDGSLSYVKKEDPSCMGIAKTALLPEDFAMGFLGKNLSTWNVLNNEVYLGRNSILLQGKLNDDYQDKHHAQKCTIRIDSETGILLEARLTDKNNQDTFHVVMNELSLNVPLNQKLFTQYDDQLL